MTRLNARDTSGPGALRRCNSGARRRRRNSATWPGPVGIPFAPEIVPEDSMLYTLAVILLIAWLLGIVGTYTIGAFVHVLLVIAVVLFLVGLISGRSAVV